MRYILEPIWKKSVTDVETWHHPEKNLWFEKENGWRWGSASFVSEEFPEIDLKNEYCIVVTEDLDDPDLECDDGCWGTYTFCEQLNEEEQQEIEDMDWEELEEQGWVLKYVNTYFSGPLKLTDENGNVWRGDDESIPQLL
jgi:hypothetical protein